MTTETFEVAPLFHFVLGTTITAQLEDTWLQGPPWETRGRVQYHGYTWLATQPLEGEALWRIIGLDEPLPYNTLVETAPEWHWGHLRGRVVSDGWIDNRPITNVVSETGVNFRVVTSFLIIHSLPTRILLRDRVAANEAERISLLHWKLAIEHGKGVQHLEVIKQATVLYGYEASLAILEEAIADFKDRTWKTGTPT